jgi:putative membrane protein
MSQTREQGREQGPERCPEQCTEPKDSLSAERTSLAYERTLMAWVRTAASLIGFGLTLYKFFEYLEGRHEVLHTGRWLGPRGYALLMISVGDITLLLATVQHVLAKRRLNALYRGLPRSVALVLALLIIGFGFFSLVMTL